MANPERGARQQGILRISAPPRERTAPPVLPRPEVRPFPPSKLPSKPGGVETKKPGIGRKTRLTLASLAALGTVETAGAVITEQTNEQPMSVQTIPGDLMWSRTAVEDFLRGIRGEIKVPDTFDNKADKGAIGANNSVALSRPEIQKQFPQHVVTEGSTVKFLFPFQLPEGTTATYAKSLSDRLPTQEVQRQALNDQVKDHIDFVLPKDTVIFSPVEGHGAIGFGILELGQDPTMAYGTAIVFYDQDKNRTYLMKIFSLNQVAFDPIVTMSRFDDKKYSRDIGWKDLPVINRSMPLMRVQSDNQQLRISIEGYEGEKIGPAATLIDKTLFLVTPQFFSSSVSSGQEQLLVLKK